MNQALKDIWKKNFPLWPDVLINKFSKAIEIQANLFTENFGNEERKFFENSKKNIGFLYSINPLQDFMQILNGQIFFDTIGIFNPPSNYTKKSNGGESFKKLYFVFLSDNQIYDYDFIIRQIYVRNFSYDDRLIDSVNGFNVSIQSKKKIESDIVIQNQFFQSRNYFLSPSMLDIYELKISINANATFKDYKGCATLKALYENGVIKNDLDYNLIYEFMDYFNAYVNYENDILSKKAVLEKKSKADLVNYKSDLDSKLINQKNDIQNLTLQLTNQTRIQEESTRRDMQQINLQALSIKLQILGLLKK